MTEIKLHDETTSELVDIAGGSPYWAAVEFAVFVGTAIWYCNNNDVNVSSTTSNGWTFSFSC